VQRLCVFCGSVPASRPPYPGAAREPGTTRARWGFGFVYGLSARDAGFAPVEAMAMSTLVFAGAAQFAAVGYVASGLAWGSSC
jgi:hypothetical protein